MLKSYPLFSRTGISPLGEIKKHLTNTYRRTIILSERKRPQMKYGTWINTETRKQFFQGWIDYIAGKHIELSPTQLEKAAEFSKYNKISQLKNFFQSIIDNQ